ncbi:MAG TPA: hypothetical protein VIT02_14885 [Burkholderiaceae bacterium]
MHHLSVPNGEAQRGQHVGLGEEHGLEREFRVSQVPLEPLGHRRGGQRNVPAGVAIEAGAGVGHPCARLGGEHQRVHLFAQRRVHTRGAKVGRGARGREFLEAKRSLAASRSVVMEVVNQRGGQHAQSPFSPEPRHAGEVVCTEHDLQEVPGVVIAVRDAGADATIDVRRDRHAGTVQRVPFVRARARRCQRERRPHLVGSRGDPLEARHDLVGHPLRVEAADDREGRPADVHVAGHRLGYRRSVPSSRASSSITASAASKS